MESSIIAVGSNIGDRHEHLQAAGHFLSALSQQPVKASAIYLTEPIGPATRYFLNAAVKIHTHLAPARLIARLKRYENENGRPAKHARWSARTIDLDIISYGHLVIHKDSLIIPHPKYAERLFVLKPLHDINADWKDPETDMPIKTMINQAANMQIKKTELAW